MDKNQKLLLTLLSAAIRGKKIENAETEGVDWRTLFEEAKAQEVHTLIYSAVRSLKGDNLPDKKLMDEWQKAALLTGINQTRHIQRMSEVLKVFNEAGVPVIALKGLVLRELYPQPEMRIMCDADVLVQKEELERAGAILEQLGYLKDRNCSNHINIQFTHEVYLAIEVHWSIAAREFTESLGNMEESLWGNAIPVNILNVTILSLSPEDQLLHLCLHMANHFIGSWLSLRHLCDLLVFVEANCSIIDWSYFFQRISSCGIIHFTKVIFLVCHLLFDMNIPDIVHDEGLENKSDIELFINDIFESSSPENDYSTRVCSGSAMFYARNTANTNTVGNLKYYISLLFPPSQRLGEKYSYCRKWPLLVPAAWIHRIVHCLFRNDFSMWDKVSFLSPAAAASFKSRAKLLHLLELR